MAETFYDSSADIRNSDAYDYYHLQSTGYGGSWTAITCPALNYPPSAPTRLFVSLPMRIDQTDLAGSRPIALKIGATTLTKVSGAPGANEYFLAPTTSERRDTIELHSSRAAATLDFDFYGYGSIINSQDTLLWPQIDISTLSNNGTTTVTFENVFRSTSKTSYNFNGKIHLTTCATNGSLLITVKSGGSYLAGTAYKWHLLIQDNSYASPYWVEAHGIGDAQWKPFGASGLSAGGAISFHGNLEYVNGLIHIQMYYNWYQATGTKPVICLMCGTVSGATTIDAMKLTFSSANAMTFDTGSKFFVQSID